MGLAIVPAYDSESDVAANAVVVTRVLNTQDVYGYSLSVQEGNNLVTNPDPGTWSEVTVAGFVSDDEPVSLTVTRFAKPTADVGGADDTGARRASRCWRSSTWPSGWSGPTAGPSRATTTSTARRWSSTTRRPKSLDLELKLLENGRLVCKQVREFGGS